MEQPMIAALLEKYWRAETTIEEEKQLAEYFTQPDIPAQWEPLRNVFAYFEEEAKVTPGEDFEARLLERILQVEAHKPAHAPVRPLLNRNPWWAAAAVIILALGLSRLIGPAQTGSPGQGSLAQSRDSAPAKESAATAYNDAATIKDTYEDPQQALAAIRHALGTASAKMNSGKSITQKQMDRMNDGWQSALTN